MKVIGVIPARYQSTRLPAKLLADILGKPMVQWVYESAQKAKLLNEILVATDDERIRSVVNSFGGQAVLTSPAHASGTDRIAEVARSSNADIVVNVQGDEPLLDPGMIDECILALQNTLRDGVEFATVIRQAGEEVWNDQDVVKVVRDLKGRALYFSRSLIPFPRRKIDAFQVFEHIGLYAYTRECLLKLSQLHQTSLEQVEGLEQLRALENGIAIQTVETQYQGELVSVDTLEELNQVRSILVKRNGNKQ